MQSYMLPAWSQRSSLTLATPGIAALCTCCALLGRSLLASLAPLRGASRLPIAVLIITWLY